MVCSRTRERLASTSTDYLRAVSLCGAEAACYALAEMTVHASAKASGYRQPAEWLRHDATWVAWPAAADLWQDNLAPAQAAFAQLVREIARGEKLHILVRDAAEEQAARAALGEHDFVRIPYGDIWLRDIAPIFLQSGAGRASVRFAFNGWGGKYILPHDSEVAARIQGHVLAQNGGTAFANQLVFEGGSVDVDGEGTALTTRQCLLNANRNPGSDEAHIAYEVCEALGLDKLVWLGDGLANDHTDGHIDNIARFIAPATVAIMKPSGADDPNREVYAQIKADLQLARDAQGRKLELVQVPSPGRVEVEGQPVPASHLNFYICNAAVIVPVYNTAYDEAALRVIEACFPGRRAVAIDSRALLSGGGSFHCITQQVPASEIER